jgi:small GTP-binding protein
MQHSQSTLAGDWQVFFYQITKALVKPLSLKELDNMDNIQQPATTFPRTSFLDSWKDKPVTPEEAGKLIKAIFSYTPRVGVFGDTGVGKSSLCNALFGKDIAKTSDVEACTREAQEIALGDGNIVLIDVPGVGEDKERHKEYVKLYAELLPKLDVVIWAIKADDRKYMTATDVYENIVKPIGLPTVFVLTQVDKIEPCREWDTKNKKPSSTQESNILRKIIDVSKRFKIPADLVIPVSSIEKYNLTALIEKIVEIVPKEKRVSIVREAAEETVSKRAAEYAQKGVWETVKEWAGTAWEAVKDAAIAVILKTMTDTAKKIPVLGTLIEKLFG